MLFVLVALAFASDAISISAGEASINLFAGQIVQQLNTILSGQTWPEIDGEADDLQYKLTGLTFNSFQAGAYTADFSNGVITVALDQSTLTMSGDLAVGKTVFGKYIQIFSTHFNANSQPSVAVAVSVTEVNGVPQIAVINTAFSLGNWNININQYVNWLIDLFQGQIGDAITGAVQQNLGPNIQQATNTALDNLPLKVDVTDLIGLDWSLTTDPQITSNGLLVDSLGGIFDPSNGQYGPYQPSGMPDADFSEPLMIVFSDAILQNIGYIYWSSGLLYIHQNFSTTFDSNTFVITVTANLTATPDVSFQPSGGVLNANGVLGLELDGISGEYTYQIVIDFELVTNSDASFYPSVTFFNVTELQLISGGLPFPASWILSTIDAQSATIVNDLNAELSSFVFNIPSVDGVSFSQPSLSYSQGYATLGLTVETSARPPRRKIAFIN